MVKFLKHDFSASVLATVLVVSTLLLLGVLMVIELWNFDLVRYNLYHQGEQAPGERGIRLPALLAG